MMPPEEYKRRWSEIRAAADRNDDAEFWRLYSEWANKTEPVSFERLAIRKMAQRVAKMFAQTPPVRR